MDLKYRIKNRTIYPIDAQANAAIISENTDYFLVFDFDKEWDGQIKTVRLRRERAKDYEDITLMENQDTVQIPAYLMKTGTLVIGVYSPEMATRPYSIRVFPSVLDYDVRQEFPDKMLYRQLLKIVTQQADLSSLSTVAISGRYSDLLEKPTGLSDFTNDAGYITNMVAGDLDVAGSVSATGEIVDGLGNNLANKSEAAQFISDSGWEYTINESGIFFGWYKATVQTEISSRLNVALFQCDDVQKIYYPDGVDLSEILFADISLEGSTMSWLTTFAKSTDEISYKLIAPVSQSIQNHTVCAFVVARLSA